jgi:hypothetical protein
MKAISSFKIRMLRTARLNLWFIVRKVAVQQKNAQAVTTNLYQSRFKNSETVWDSYGLPSNKFNDFTTDSVLVPKAYLNKKVVGTPYLDITFSDKGLHYEINGWLFGQEIADEYHSENGIGNSYLKYQWDWLWNGSEFQATKTTLSDYTDVVDMKATIDEPTDDGPDIAEFDCGHGVSVIASKELSSADNRYVASNLLDGKPETAWAAPTGGIGQSVTFTITEDFVIGDSWHIITGYTKSPALWKANNRVKKMKVFVNGKRIASVTLSDSDRHQSFSITETWMPWKFRKGDKIKFEVEEIYKGDKYDDTLISYFVPTGNCG